MVDAATFRVDARPDAGDFATGDQAGLKWDVLRRVGGHHAPDVVDLSECVHLKPYAIACLCALAELAKLQGRAIRLLVPRVHECRTHLSRLGLFRFFDCDEPDQPARDTNLVVQRIGWPPGDEGERMIDLLAPRVDLPAGVFPRIAAHLDEIITNALTHAVSPIDCLVAGQAFDGTGKVEIAILDLGIGIRGHLTRHPKYASVKTDREAIDKATQEGVTGTLPGKLNMRNQPNSGAGLWELREYCHHGGGEMTILSGYDWLTYSNCQKAIHGRLRQEFRGCLVNIRFFTKEYLPARQVEPII